MITEKVFIVVLKDYHERYEIQGVFRHKEDADGFYCAHKTNHNWDVLEFPVLYATKEVKNDN